MQWLASARIVAAFVAILIATPILPVAAFGDASEPHRPAQATAVGRGDGTTVLVWTPGLEPVDSYRIYGFTKAGAATLIAEVMGHEETVFLASTRYPQFGVSGVVGPQESTPAFAGTITPPRTATDPCVMSTPGDMPPVHISLTCLPEVIRLPPPDVVSQPKVD